MKIGITQTFPQWVKIIYNPPYNSRAKDWKYNNDYVDPTDSYRHSKWLSMMKRRLTIAKRILNPQCSVLIVTIDEKEYLHLGCLLEDMFPEAHIQMVSSVINPKGSARDGFSRSDEYIFFVMFGECTPARLPLSNEWSSSAIVSAQEKVDDNREARCVEPGWTSMMRRGTDSMRTDSPNLYYPIYVDPDTKIIKKVGTPIPLGQDRAEEISGLVQVLPLRRNGTQGRWQVGNGELKNRIRQGRVRLGRPTAYGFVINYLPDGEYAKVVNGEYEIQSYAADGSMVAYKTEHKTDELRMPPTQWKIASHNASENGTTLLTTVIGEKRFPFPKSLYAVRDTLRFFVADNPNALIVDFFAGKMSQKLKDELSRIQSSQDFEAVFASITGMSMKTLEVELATNQVVADGVQNISVAQPDTEALYKKAEKTIGDYIAMQYRIENSRRDNMEVKVELIVLASDVTAMDNLEQYAGVLFDETYNDNRRAIQTLGSAERDKYERLVSSGSDAIPLQWRAPFSISFNCTATSSEYENHLYVGDSGKCRTLLNSWEDGVIQEELSRPDFVAWLRNLDRKNWSIEIPYKAAGVNKPMYPDMMVV